MTEENNRSIRYLTKQDIADIHADLSAQVLRDGDEPLPEFRYGKQHEIDALIAAPQQRLFGRDAYPTLAEKAAIIFYTVNRKHIFPNGNKRMSTACLMTFLLINDAGCTAEGTHRDGAVARDRRGA
jgi:death-on-curing protein